jgi:hypothetical protein
MDLHITHDRVGSSTDPTLNGQLRYPNNLDQSLNDATADKVRKYRADYNMNPPNTVSFQTHRETDHFFAASGVQLAQTDRGMFHYRRAAFSAQLKSKVVLTLTKEEDLRITLNLDGVSIISKSHTHPSHSQTSRLLTSSLSLGVPVPRTTQCMRGMQIHHL